MNSEDEEKKKKKRKHKVQILEDIIILILNCLPLKTLYRLKSVSKSWSRLIMESHRAPPFVGLFYQVDGPRLTYRGYIDSVFHYIDRDGIHNSTIDPTLSFLHPLPFPCRHITDLLIQDCCNGLLLLRSKLTDDSFVCNPHSRSWARFCYAERMFSLLDFNPQVSSHFKIVSFSQIQNGQLHIRVLSSSEAPKMRWRRCKPVDFRDPSDASYVLMSRTGNHHVLWEGSFYSLLRRDSLDFRDHGKTMRFSGLFEGDGAAVHCQHIELPVGTEKPSSVSIGRSGDKLYLAGLDCSYVKDIPQARVRVWSLSSRDQTIWAMEHDSILSSKLPNLYGPSRIGGFHPLLDVLFILCKNMAYAYDLKKLSFGEVWRIGCYTASIFPFSPLFAGLSGRMENFTENE